MASEFETLSAIESSGHLNPVQASRLRELKGAGARGNPFGIESSAGSFLQTTGGLERGREMGSFDPLGLARQLRGFAIESNQPQISSLQAQIPEVEQRYAQESARLTGEKEPLKQRYANIIDQLTGREKADIGLAQQRTGREFGYRGIPASSSLYLDELQRAESPIRQTYGGQIKEVGLAQETGLRGIDQMLSQLAGQSTEAKRTIQNAIGQLQSGNTGDALQGAMQILGLQQQQSQFQTQNTLAQQQQSLREREFGLQEKLATQKQESPYMTLGEGESLFNIKSLQEVFKNPKTFKAGGGGGKGNYYDSTSSEPRPTGKYPKVGTFSPKGQWILSNDGWAPVVS
mgnify:CR=1 FL=1